MKLLVAIFLISGLVATSVDRSGANGSSPHTEIDLRDSVDLRIPLSIVMATADRVVIARTTEVDIPYSKHLSGGALDVIDRSIGYENGQFSKTPSHISWNIAIRDAAAANGLRWGGSFVKQDPITGKWQGRWDPNHVEMP